MSLPYPTKVVLPFDIATAQDMNERHANDVALADGTGLDAGAVGTVALAQSAVTPDKLNLNAGSASGSVSNTTSTSFVSTGLSFDVTVGQSGVLLLGIAGLMSNTGSGNATRLAYQLSGANTVNAGNPTLIQNRGNLALGFGRTFLLTGLNPGVTTVTLMKGVDGGTGEYFGDPNIWAIPLG